MLSARTTLPSATLFLVLGCSGPIPDEALGGTTPASPSANTPSSESGTDAPSQADATNSSAPSTEFGEPAAGQDAGPATDTGASADTTRPATGGACAATETLCDGIDDDCNGQIDDLDAGSDGFCDCLRIGIAGSSGYKDTERFQAWLEARGTSVVRFAAADGSRGLDGQSLSAFDVVLLDWVGQGPEEESRVVSDFVESGGGIISLTGYANDYVDAQAHNTLLHDLGVQYDLNSIYFDSNTQTFLQHPVTTGVSQVAFRGGLRVLGAPEDTVLAKAFDAIPIGVAAERGLGRAIVWGDEWITFDSEWSNLPGVERFWREMLRWVGPRESCQVPSPIIK